MMRTNIISGLAALIFLIQPVCSKEIKYRLSDVSNELKQNVKAVIRNHSVELEIFSPEQAVKRVIYAVTVLKDNGMDKANFMQFYNKFITISKIHGTVYNKDGEPVQRISGDEILDYSAISGFSLYQDSRVKFIQPKYRIVPFTVEYTYEIKYDGLLSFPEWMPCEDYNISVEQSSVTIITPSAYKFRYKEMNLNAQPEILEKNQKKIYKWHLVSFPALSKEEYSLPVTAIVPAVYFAPTDFVMDKYTGNCETWESFGNWFRSLNEGKNNLTEERRKEIRNLVNGAENDRDKIRILYQYMQNRTRYVSIQLGIGGWQPFDAAVVDKTGYGDCKALTNYMKTLLECAGIRSYYTLVNAGRDKNVFLSDFPSNQFNHVILFVPLKEDTVWLECTSQHSPFGYLGTFTDDRDVLVISESGGVLVRTPSFSSEENSKTSSMEVKISKGISLVNLCISYSGMFYDEMMPVFMDDFEGRKKKVENILNVQNSDIRSFEFRQVREKIPALKLVAAMEFRNLSTEVNKRLIIPVTLFKRTEIPSLSARERRSDIYIERSFSVCDSVRFVLPEHYQMEQIPENRQLVSPYGKYTLELSKDGNQILAIRKLVLNKGIYPRQGYDRFYSFIDNINKLDNSKIILQNE